MSVLVPYFESEDFKLYLGDCIQVMSNMPEGSVDMIFADPPYFLSSGGITCKSGKMVSVDKADWDKEIPIGDIHNFNITWLSECKRVLAPSGTIWVSGTYHNIYSIGFALQSLGYKILNNITWYKGNAAPNLSCRYFTHSTETIIWCKREKDSVHYFDYQYMKGINNGKQMRDVWKIDTNGTDELWEISTPGKREKEYGEFPTQKPLKLLERVIIAATQEGHVVLDPFNGSGTTGIASQSLKRKYIGIDISTAYLDLTIRRLKGVSEQQKLI